jgi:hypothetical protein
MGIADLSCHDLCALNGHGGIGFASLVPFVSLGWSKFHGRKQTASELYVRGPHAVNSYPPVGVHLIQVPDDLLKLVKHAFSPAQAMSSDCFKSINLCS